MILWTEQKISMVFNPTDYLTSHGWSGPGTGLTSTSRAKPLAAIQKKNNFGIGKDRDTGFAWWDDVFAKVADKVGKPPIQEGFEAHLLSRTVTGLVSPLPPPISKLPSHSEKSIKSSLNLQAMDYAKQSAARGELYRRFLRGVPIVGTIKEQVQEAKLSTILPKSPVQELVSEVREDVCPMPSDKSLKKKKRKRSIHCQSSYRTEHDYDLTSAKSSGARDTCVKPMVKADMNTGAISEIGANCSESKKSKKDRKKNQNTKLKVNQRDEGEKLRKKHGTQSLKN
ncbi:hypothetical protein O181_041621 [Austropuccinia psidii MF-1]|uniref:G patch domain-containing protein 4 n=1 Tax=Austropuccinia psidii MF-1 TaxID=1389203 RepID=A0A9Q3DK18_9BASI|nr:hypothetical protein [Austropuccinia psidii MF-1]